MNIQKLDIQDVKLVKQCDNMFVEFLDGEGKYDENYLKREQLNSFINDLNDSNNILFVAKQDETVIGFLYGYIEKRKGAKLPVAHLGFLYVNGEYRNRKVATKLIDTFIVYIKGLDIKIIEVKVFENNIAAKKLYDKYGFNALWSNYRKKI
ncbi:MAG: GNAT family N-acetyltransferase [Clostridia bacterium]|nr:GNAT family N-acetyltransferase [Clostridia bacterium]